MKSFLEKNQKYILIIICTLCVLNIIDSMNTIKDDIKSLAERELEEKTTKKENNTNLININFSNNINTPKIDYTQTEASIIRSIVLSVLNIVLTLIVLLMIYIEEKLKNLRIMNSLE